MGGNRYYHSLGLMCSVSVRTSLTRERYKLGTSMKEMERGGQCDLYRGLAMAQVFFDCCFNGS